jgi:nicotinamide mononucleotide adenylyltransferase
MQNRYLKLEINKDLKNIHWPKINNAYILSFKRYNHNDDLFFELFHAFNSKLKLFFDELITYNNTSDPFNALKNRLLQLKEKS